MIHLTDRNSRGVGKITSILSLQNLASASSQSPFSYHKVKGRCVSKKMKEKRQKVVDHLKKNLGDLAGT